MSRIYTVEFSGVSVSAAQDFFEILPATQKPCQVTGIHLFQSSDVGDSEEEILRCRVIRGHTTSGSGGTAPTPRPRDSNDVAAGFSSEVNNTTIASAGTAVNLMSFNFNVRVGYELWLPNGHEFRVQNAELLVVRLLAAPADAVTMAGTLFVEEL